MIDNIHEHLYGQDASKEISLFEYGLLVAQGKIVNPEQCEHDDEYFVVYKTAYDINSGYLRESELSDLVLGNDWMTIDDRDKFLSSCGVNLPDWMGSSFINKLSDLIGYYGYENIMGSGVTNTGSTGCDEAFARHRFLGESVLESFEGGYPDVDVLGSSDKHVLGKHKETGEAFYFYINTWGSVSTDHSLSEVQEHALPWFAERMASYNLNLAIEEVEAGHECYDKIVEAGEFAIIIGESRGIYIPRDFEAAFGDNVVPYDGWEEDRETLKDPDNEWYWGAMISVEQKGILKFNGKLWDIEQAGDLWIYEHDKPRAYSGGD